MNPKIKWDFDKFIKALAGVLFTRKLGREVFRDPPNLITPKKIAGGFRVSILKVV